MLTQIHGEELGEFVFKIIFLGLDQWFSNFGVCQNHLKGLWKQITGPHPRDFVEFCISNRFSGLQLMLVWGSQLENCCPKRMVHTWLVLKNLNMRLYHIPNQSQIWAPVMSWASQEFPMCWQIKQQSSNPLILKLQCVLRLPGHLVQTQILIQ